MPAGMRLVAFGLNTAPRSALHAPAGSCHRDYAVKPRTAERTLRACSHRLRTSEYAA